MTWWKKALLFLAGFCIYFAGIVVIYATGPRTLIGKATGCVVIIVTLLGMAAGILSDDPVEKWVGIGVTVCVLIFIALGFAGLPQL